MSPEPASAGCGDASSLLPALKGRQELRALACSHGTGRPCGCFGSCLPGPKGPGSAGTSVKCSRGTGRPRRSARQAAGLARLAGWLAVRALIGHPYSPGISFRYMSQPLASVHAAGTAVWGRGGAGGGYSGHIHVWSGDIREQDPGYYAIYSNTGQEGGWRDDSLRGVPPQNTASGGGLGSRFASNSFNTGFLHFLGLAPSR